MELFREEYPTIQDDLRVDPSREESINDDVDYSNDDLGENTEITPLGDAVEEDEINDSLIDPDDEDYGDDVDVDLDTEEDIEEDDDIADINSQIDPDDDLEDDDDDLLSDDDDLDTTITPDLDDDDDLLADDDFVDDDEDLDDEATASADTNADFTSRPHGRVTGTMLDHEPGLPGSDRL
ncbi:MAG: hypothetical protein H7Y13_01480 [Sphingobacteriaceae bacterium]|nr:hypothetical protein [Sphingobacteriaceae bacterium]